LKKNFALKVGLGREALQGIWHNTVCLGEKTILNVLQNIKNKDPYLANDLLSKPVVRLDG